MIKSVQGLVAILIVVSTLAGCGVSFGQPARDVAVEFDRLARYVPASADFPLFFDLKPEGDAGQRWARLRDRLEADASGEMLLTYVLGRPVGQSSMIGQFKAEDLGLMDAIEGPAVSGWWDAAQYVILQVSNERDARDALIRNLGDASAWEQKSFEGRTLYNGEFMEASGETTYLSWAVGDGLVFLTYRTSPIWFNKLEALLTLAEEDALAAQPAWDTLRSRLPEGLIAASFTSLGRDALGSPPPYGGDDPLNTLPWYVEAVMLAGVPEANGVRIYLDGTFASDVEDVPAFESLFALPPVDATEWTALPADTALAIASHDAATAWLWMRTLFSGQDIMDAFGAGLVEPLVAPYGPLSGAFAVAVTPPLAGQPVLSGVPALQFVATSPDTARLQAEALEATLQEEGGVFADDSVEGVAIRRQVGLEISGYAPAYGFDGDTFYLGSSPQAIGKGIVARRDNSGLVTQRAYQVFLGALPDDPFYVAYLNSDSLVELVQINAPDSQDAEGSLYGLVRPLDGIGFGLALTPERLDGVLYLVILE